jgi:subtilisin family serine protease
LDFAIKVQPNVVSMSLGSSSTSDAEYQRIKKLYEMNIPVVCAAGNSGGKGVEYPAKYPETIAVAAYDKNGFIANFSAVGEEVDFAAPGVEIYSTYLNNEYAMLAGTSMATPWITGVILLLLSKHLKQEKETGQNDCKTVEQIKEHLRKYTIDKGYVGKDKYYGYGIIDVEHLIESKEAVITQPIIVENTRWTKTRNFLNNLLWGLFFRP